MRARAVGGLPMRIWKPHSGRVRAVSFKADGSVLVTIAGESKFVWVWDAGTGQRVAKFKGHETGLRRLAVSSDGHLAVSGDRYNRTHVWDLLNGSCLAQY